MTDEVIEPTAYQARVLSVPEGIDLFLGGGRGGGKSHCKALLILRHIEQYRERARVLYVRKTYKGLADFELVLRSLFSAAYGSAASYNASEHVFRLPYGYVELAQVDTVSAYDKVQGRSFTLILIDELTQWVRPDGDRPAALEPSGPEGRAPQDRLRRQPRRRRAPMGQRPLRPAGKAMGAVLDHERPPLRPRPEHLQGQPAPRRRGQRLLGSLDDKLQQRRADFERTLADLPKHESTNIINRTVSGARAELKQSSADARKIHVREAGRLRSEVAGCKPLYAAAVQMLARHNLGSERRSRILEQIAESGPAELAALAEFAAATRDKELGAALCSKVAKLMPSERPFNAHDLADVLVGDEHRKVTVAIMEIERLVEEALNEDGAFERNGLNPARTMAIAKMKQAEAEVGADLSDDEQEEEAA